MYNEEYSFYVDYVIQQQTMSIEKFYVDHFSYDLLEFHSADYWGKAKFVDDTWVVDLNCEHDYDKRLTLIKKSLVEKIQEFGIPSEDNILRSRELARTQFEDGDNWECCHEKNS